MEPTILRILEDRDESPARGPRNGPNVLPVIRVYPIEKICHKPKKFGDLNQIFRLMKRFLCLKLRFLQISNRVYYRFPIICVCKIARVEQTHKKWNADSGLMEHAPQIGLDMA
jgi:hypothetical protein